MRKVNDTSSKDLWDIVQIVGVTLIPVVIALLGYWFSAALTKSQSNQKMVELAIGILQTDSSENPIPGLTHWASEVVERYSGVPLSSAARAELEQSRLALLQTQDIERRLTAIEYKLYMHVPPEFEPKPFDEAVAQAWLLSLRVPIQLPQYGGSHGISTPYMQENSRWAFLHQIDKVNSIRVGEPYNVGRAAGTWMGPPDGTIRTDVIAVVEGTIRHDPTSASFPPFEFSPTVEYRMEKGEFEINILIYSRGARVVDAHPGKMMTRYSPAKAPAAGEPPR